MDIRLVLLSVLVVSLANGVIALMLTVKCWQIWGAFWRRDDPRWKLDWSVTLFFWTVAIESFALSADLANDVLANPIEREALSVAWLLLAISSVLVGYHSVREQRRRDAA